MKRIVAGKNYDLTGNEIARVDKMYFIHRWLPLGNLGGMTRLRELLVLSVMHWFGLFFFRVLIRFENVLTRLYSKYQVVKGNK